MTLRTGLIITGDTDGAQKAVSDLAAEMGRAGNAAKNLGAAEGVVEAATESLEAELRQARAALDGMVGELNQMREAAAATAGRIDVLETQLARASVAGRANVRSMGEQALGARMLGQQFLDVGVMAQMGLNSVSDGMRIVAMQGPQMALALEQMGTKGALGRAMAAMGTPWGAAIAAAVMVLGPFVSKLFEASGTADDLAGNLDKAASSADSFGNAQSMLGKVIDLNTGKLKTHNLVLIETIRLQAEAMLLAGQKAESDARKSIGSVGDLSITEKIAGGLAADQGYRGNLRKDIKRENAPLSQLRGDVLEGSLSVTDIRQRVDAMVQAGQLAGYSSKQIVELKQQLYTLPQALNDQKAAQQSLDAIDGKGVATDLKPWKAPGKPKKGGSGSAREEFGRDAADRIASITEAFDDTPAAVRQADRAIRQLDDLIDDLGRKKPANFAELIAGAQAAKQTIDGGLLRSLSEAYKAPETLAEKAAPALGAIDDVIRRLSEQRPAGFEKLIADAQAARGVIQDGILRPYSDFLVAQEQSLDILTLQAKGQNDQAEALRTIVGLERQLGPLRDDQKDAILASVQAIRAQQREVEILRQDTQKYIDALSSIEGIVKDASQAFVRGEFGQLLKSPGKLLDAFQTLKGRELFDKLFAGTFRDLQDQINGTSVVQDASSRMAAAVDGVTASTARTTGALDKLASSAARTAGAIGNDGAIDKAISGAISSAAVQAIGGVGATIASLVRDTGAASGEILVTGSRKGTLSSSELFTKSIGDVSSALLNVFTNDTAAKKIGGAIGKFAGKGLEGAATGSIVSGISNALGIKMNSTGSQIGGAIGKMTGIPGGDIIGSIAGGLIGNLFNKPKYGTASISGQSAAAIAGNAGSAKSGAGTLAGAVQSGIAKIAETLGGELGNYKVSIGTFDGKYRVSTTGFTGSLDSKKAKGQGLHDFGKDGADAAISFAIADAIKDGAVTGLSGAVQQALRGNADIDAALKEALKVADVEQLLGGLPAEMAKAFKDFEKTAAERVRIARQYGFDVVEIEKRNAQDRLNLQKQLMEEQVGSLQRLVDEMTGGSLFEGSAVDQRAAILKAIGSAEADLDAGVAGAADKLATLYEQLNAVSEAVYGTTGGFAVDRAAILDQARAAIAKANADINAAAGKASDPALATTNAALDENNDQNARIIDAIRRQGELLEAYLAAGGSGTGYLSQIARTS